MALPPFLQQAPSMPGSFPGGVQRYISPGRYANSGESTLPHRQLRPNEPTPPNQQQGGGGNISGLFLLQRLAEFLRQQEQQGGQQGGRSLFPKQPQPLMPAPPPMSPGDFITNGEMPGNQPANLPNVGPPPQAAPSFPQRQGGQQRPGSFPNLFPIADNREPDPDRDYRPPAVSHIPPRLEESLRRYQELLQNRGQQGGRLPEGILGQLMELAGQSTSQPRASNPLIPYDLMLKAMRY